MNTGPCIVHVTNLLALHQRKTFIGPNNIPLGLMAPKTALPILCIVNGQYVLQEDWDLCVSNVDHVTFITLPQGNGDSNPLMVILALVVVAVGIYTGNEYLIAAGVGLLAAGLLAPQAFLPLDKAESPSPTYNISLTGNIARLGQPIPVPYGRHIITPDFAAQPYAEYIGNDQYYHALFCIGMGERRTIEKIMIDDTAIDHFSEVQIQIVGSQYEPTLHLVNPCVVTAPEVADQDLLKDKPVGPFTICGPGLETDKIGIDVICPKGLFQADSEGNLGNKTLSWAVEIRKMKSDGTINGPWIILGQESLTDKTSTPIRRSYFYPITAGRYEVRCTRLDARDENVRAGHDLKWIGLRAYLTEEAELDPNAVYVAVKMKATSQLSGLSQRKFQVIQRRWLKTWQPSSGWSDYVDSKSIAWAMVDILKNEVYGGSIDDSRIDLETFYRLDTIWAKRQDYFNGIFDRRVTIWQALRSLAQAGRATPLMRGSMFTVVRDQKISLPSASFTMSNIVKGSFNVDYTVYTENDSDGVELEYFDEVRWATQYVTVPYPGLEESLIPAKISIAGITNQYQALREASHLVQDAYARRAQVTFETEMEGYLPSYGDTILVSHDITSWGLSGEIESWQPPMATTTEKVNIGFGRHYAVLVDEFGDLHGPYLVESGFNELTMKFIDLPDFVPYTGVEKLRTRFSVGPATNFGKVCKVTSLSPSEENQIRITAVTDDTMVYDEDDEGNVIGGPGAPLGSLRIAHYMADNDPKYAIASDAQRDPYGGYYADDSGYIGSDLGYAYASDDPEPPRPPPSGPLPDDPDPIPPVIPPPLPPVVGPVGPTDPPPVVPPPTGQPPSIPSYSPVTMEIGANYSTATGNYIVLVDFNNVRNLFPIVTGISGWSPPGTSVQVLGAQVIISGIPSGTPQVYGGTITVEYAGGAGFQHKLVEVNVVYGASTQLPPNIKIVPIVVPSTQPSSTPFIDVDGAVSPSFEIYGNGVIPPGMNVSFSSGFLWLNGMPTQTGEFHGIVKISYVGVGSPQMKYYSITIV